MAIQQLLRGRGAGELLGTSLGQGLSGLLQNRIAKLQQRKMQQSQASGLASLLGITPQQAAPLTSLATPLLNQILKQGMMEDFGAVQSPQAQNDLMGQEVEQQPDQLSDAMRELEMFNYNPMDSAVRQLQQPGAQARQQGIDPSGIVNTPVERAIDTDVRQVEQFPVGRRMTKAQALQARKEGFEKTKQAKKEQVILNRENKPAVKKIMDDYKTALDENRDLDRMEQLINTKNLTNPAIASAVKTISKGIFGFGMDFSSFMSSESQEFEKISMGFLKNLKTYFGARITQIEVENFIKTIPSLLQTRDGKRRVIYNLRVNNEAKQLRRKALGKLRSKYGNNLPTGVNELVEDMISPQLDKLAEKFKKGRPEKQHKEKGLFDRIPGPSKVVNEALSMLFGKG